MTTIKDHDKEKMANKNDTTCFSGEPISLDIHFYYNETEHNMKKEYTILTASVRII